MLLKKRVKCLMKIIYIPVPFGRIYSCCSSSGCLYRNIGMLWQGANIHHHFWHSPAQYKDSHKSCIVLSHSSTHTHQQISSQSSKNERTHSQVLRNSIVRCCSKELLRYVNQFIRRCCCAHLLHITWVKVTLFFITLTIWPQSERAESHGKKAIFLCVGQPRKVFFYQFAWQKAHH